MTTKLKNSFIYIEDDKPSRFVVDLKQKFLESEKNLKPQFDWKNTANKYLQLLKISLLPLNKNIKELAVFSLFATGYIFIKKSNKILFFLMNKTGWTFIFIVRFFYFFIKRILLPLLKLFNVINSNLLIFQSYLKNLPALMKNIFLNLIKRFSVYKHKTSLTKQIAKEESKIILSSEVFAREKTLNPILIFTLSLIIIILPFKFYDWYISMNNLRGQVLGVSESAINNMISGGQSAAQLNIETAEKKLLSASDNFTVAQEQISKINLFLLKLSSLLPNKDIKLASQANNILELGKNTADLGQKYLAIAKTIKETNSDLKEKIITIRDLSVEAQALAEKIENQIFKIDVSTIPPEYSEIFLASQNYAKFIKQATTEISSLTKQLIIFLGISDNQHPASKKRYLAVFQNNTEMRASGGFIGSYALVDFTDGKLTNLEAPKGGTYDSEAGLRDFIVSPEPLHIIKTRWFLWDANWWPDWPKTAKKLMWFYEKSDGPTVDGVISFTPDVLGKILEITGPIDLTSDYGVILSSDNFLGTIQEIVEQKNTKEPKKIIGDLAHKLIELTPQKLTGENAFNLIKITEQSLREKNILFYFTNESLQSYIDESGWSGKITDTANDYLQVVNTNIAGGKSDQKISQKITHTAEIQPDGSVIDDLIIVRKHNGLKNEPFTGVRNVNWLRIYVPDGSQLLVASGFKSPDSSYFKKPEPTWKNDPDLDNENNESFVDSANGTKIYNESNKTIFANWTIVDPGEEITIHVRYKLPLNLLEKSDNTQLENIKKILNPATKNIHAYSLLIQKQPGSYATEIKSSAHLNQTNYNIVWHYPKDLKISTEKNWLVETILDTDKFFAFIFE